MNTKSITILIVTAVAASALHCGPKSGYTPANIRPGEITWRFDGALEAARGTETVASAPGFTGLGDAVACVPEAASEASDASRAFYAGWTFLGIGLGGTLGGTGLAVAGAVDNDTDKLLPALAIVGGGVVATLIGVGIQAATLPNAVDAVNIYNDKYESVDACK
jgi:hypothetical protein